MNRNRLITLVLLLGLAMAGCANFPRKTAAPPQFRPRAFALAVTVHRVLQPTPQQFANIQASVARELARYGWVLVTDLALADSILRIDFIPHPADPENRGVAELLAVRPNPRLAFGRTTSIGRYPTSFGYIGTFQNASWGYGSFSNSSPFGWSDAQYDGFSYGSANLSPTGAPLNSTPHPIHPPHRHDPSGRYDCPPSSDHYVRWQPGDLTGESTSNPWRGHSPLTPGAGDRGHWQRNLSGDVTPSFTAAPADNGAATSSNRSWRSRSTQSDSDRTLTRAAPSMGISDRNYGRSGGTGSSRSDRSYSRSDSSESRRSWSFTNSESPASQPDSTFSSATSSSSWRGRSEGSSWRSESSGDSGRGNWRSESSGDSGRGHWRSESSSGGSDRGSWRSDSSHSHSRGDSSHGHSRSQGTESAPAPAPAPVMSSPEPSAPSAGESAPAPAAEPTSGA